MASCAQPPLACSNHVCASSKQRGFSQGVARGVFAGCPASGQMICELPLSLLYTSDFAG